MYRVVSTSGAPDKLSIVTASLVSTVVGEMRKATKVFVGNSSSHFVIR